MVLQIGLSDKDWKKSSFLVRLLFCMLIKAPHVTFSSNIASQDSSRMPKVIYTVLKSSLRKQEAVNKEYSCELRLQMLF